MKKMKYFLAILATGMIVTAGIGQAMAYFTTYAESQGSIPVRIGDETTITEEMDGWDKIMAIENKEGSEPVFIRVRAYPEDLVEYVTGTGWETRGSDGWYYYRDPVAGGEVIGGKDENGNSRTNGITVRIKPDKIPQNPAEGDVFDVVVLYESTPVRYNSDGTTYADWDVEVDYSDDRDWKGEGEKGGAD